LRAKSHQIRWQSTVPALTVENAAAPVQGTDVTYHKDLTGLLVIDPYNDFISEGGKVWDRLKGNLRVRILGRRAASRVPAATGRHHCPRALVFKRFR
jgi:hypothetical protein